MSSLTILASGSAGNAALLTTPTARLLIDCGVSCRELERRMDGIEPIGSLPGDAVLVTHEHIDHVAGLPVVVRSAMRRGGELPVYLTPMAAARMDWGRLECPDVRHFAAGRPFQLHDIGVEPFTVLHDAADPVNFRLCVPDLGLIGWSTDLGTIPPAMKRLFRDCRVVVLESNHDEEMLRYGPYPQDLKERVAGPLGHLSNAQAAEFMRESLGPATETVVLGHLSEPNNTPQKAEWSARRALLESGHPARLLVASQGEALMVA